MKWEEHSEDLKLFKLAVARVAVRQIFTEIPKLTGNDFQGYLLQEIIKYDLTDADIGSMESPKIAKMIGDLIAGIKTHVAMKGTKGQGIRYKT